MKNYYIKFSIKYSLIYEIMEKLGKQKINIFIDLQSIARGFYNKETVLVEIGRYATDGAPSNIFITELKDFLNNLYRHFKKYDPFFVLFYDDGYNSQNKIIDKSYKSGRKTLEAIYPDEDVELFRQLKKYYFSKIPLHFEKPNLSKVYYLRDYESDFIPHYCIVNDLFDSKSKKILNLILSVDKDLLQTCKFKNTIQYVPRFIKEDGRHKLSFSVFDSDNAIEYIYKNFRRGSLTAEYIPLILAISGDKSDNIDGLPRYGPAKAIKLILENKLPPKLDQIKRMADNLPQVIKDNLHIIEQNMKLIDFEEQIKRLPRTLNL